MPSLPLRKRVRNLLFYFFIRAIIVFCNALPRRWAHVVGRSVGRLGYYLRASDRAETIKNLRDCFGEERGEDWVRKTARSVFENIGVFATDAFRLAKRSGARMVDQVEIVGIEHFDAVYNRGKGLMGITAHVSNFELLAATLSVRGYKTGAIGRRLFDPRLNELLVEYRSRYGMIPIDSSRGIRQVVKALKNGYAVGALVDQDSTRLRGEFVNFFGRQAYTPIGPFELARKLGAGLVPLVIVMKPDTKYVLRIWPEVRFDDSLDEKAGLLKAMQECSDRIEQTIREYPDQWVWMHKRWKTRPHDPVAGGVRPNEGAEVAS